MAKMIILSLLWLLLSISHVAAQGVESPKLKELKGNKLEEELTPRQHKKGLWGYADADGKFIIKPVFTKAYPYEEGVARVCVDGYWGVIGENGLYVVEPRFEQMSRFSADSLAIVVREGQYFLINSRGDYVNSEMYSLIRETEYGYIVRYDNLYGTLDHKGSTLLPLQFEKLGSLERERGLYLFQKDGKWGVLKDGCEILVHKWDSPLDILSNDVENTMNFYVAIQDGSVGVVSSDGRYLTPSIYDKVYLDSSRQYYITCKDNRYGALSLKFSEIAPPIYDAPPVITNDIFRVYSGEKYYAANVRGAIELRHCDDLYRAFRPDDYATTLEIPVWMKYSLIEENVAKREEKINEARWLSNLLANNKFDLSVLDTDENLPNDVALKFPCDDLERYGVMSGVCFERASGTINHNNTVYKVLFRTSDRRVSLLSNNPGNEHYILANNRLYSLRELFESFNIKVNNGVYPKDVVCANGGDIIVRMAFLRNSNEADAPLVEMDSTKLPKQVSRIVVHTGSIPTANCSDAIVILSGKRAEYNGFSQLQSSDPNQVVDSKFGGFYTSNAKNLLVDSESILRRYDDSGNLQWAFYADHGEKFYDIEETENYIYLCGSIDVAGSQQPLLLQLTKWGRRRNVLTEEVGGCYMSGIKCDGFLLYAKLTSCDSGIETDYYPRYVMEDLDDDIGITPCCVWDNWGGKAIGGCGLVNRQGEWLQAPVLSSEQECASFYWAFKEFRGDVLIFRHLGKYGVINRDGDMVIDPKYDAIEYLENPNYVRVTLGGRCGVLRVDGLTIIPIQYDYIGDMSEDIIIVGNSGRYGCYDKLGNQIIANDYTSIGEFSDGIAVVSVLNRYGYINNRGESIIPPFADMAYPFSDGCARVVVDGFTGYIDTSGEWVVPPFYDDGGNCSCGVIPVSADGSYFYINTKLRVLSHYQYSVAEDIDPKFRIARVSIDDKWGVINEYGKLIVPIKYDVVDILPDGYIYVEENGRCGVYDTYGNLCFPVIYKWIDYERGKPLYRRSIVTLRDDKSLYKIDNKGNYIYNYASFVDE